MTRVLLVTAILLGISRQFAVADDPFRAIEVSEIHRTLDAALLSDLDNSDARVAARAALAIGRTKRGGLDALLAHASSSNASVRAMSVYALGLEGDGRPAIGAALGRAAADENSAVRYAAVDALGRIQRDHPVTDRSEDALAEELLAIAARDPNANVRGHAVLQLDVFKDAPSAKRVAAALQRLETSERDPGVRWHVAFTLYRGYATFADGAFLARMLRDRSELVRVETLRAYGKRADRATVALVSTLLADPSWRVQYEARETLRAIAKLPRTEHLKSVPPGTHLPRPSGAAIPYTLDAETIGVAPFEDPRAPDPATFPLSSAPLPLTAAAMNGPAPGPHPRVLIRTTRGDVVVRLYPEWAPSTVANFLQLASTGYFDGNRWFRIVPDFVVQTGDPTGDPDAEAGYTIPAEENPIEQRSGIIAMGLDYEGGRAVRDSAGTQFYITLSPQPYLGRDFSVFGEIESGSDVVANLVERDRMTLVRRIDDR
ncbi:MAG: peptidylprolyl isomerase [Candidatus Eremiobacteraeota bacterium]|nr:peptidylprolyl isomerase [Candidatus Eremiobacteraeota bacterium]